MRELWSRILSTSGAKLYAAFVGVFTLSITARVLGPDGRGQVAAITTWVGMFATFGSLSLGQIAIHRAARGGEQGASWLPRAFSVLGSFTIAATMIGWLLALAISQGSSLFNHVAPALLALGFALLPMMLWEQYGNALLMAREQLHISNRAQVLAALRRRFGDERVVDGAGRLRQRGREEQLASLPTVQRLALDPSTIWFAMPLPTDGQKGVTGEVGLARGRTTGLSLRLCVRGKQVGVFW